MTPLIPTQADREAAATAYAWQRGAMEEHHASILSGSLDEHPLVGLFAAHRIAACNSHGGLVSALEAIASAEHDASIDPYNDHDLGYSLGLRDQARIARRALSKAKGEAL